jgi:hypothetical protein
MQVRLGAMSPSLREQGFDDEDGRLQEDAAAIARLHVRGLLTATETRNAERRLVKRLLPLTPSSPERNDG